MNKVCPVTLELDVSSKLELPYKLLVVNHQRNRDDTGSLAEVFRSLVHRWHGKWPVVLSFGNDWRI